MYNIVTDYGATGNGTTDDTAAFTAAMAVGGAIAVPAGTYRVSAASDACIVATRPTRLVGDGMGVSIIMPDAATASGVDALTLRPAVAGISDGWGLQDIGIQPHAGSGMRHAVRIDLSATGAYLARGTFERMSLVAGAGADSAFKLDNPTNTDGLFCGEICGKGVIVGGINLCRVGDSFAIRGQTITGPNLGISLQGVPGAAQVKIEDNNITSAGGAIFLQSMQQVLISGNQCEQSSVYTGTLGAMLVLSACSNCQVEFNNLNTYGNLDCVIIENGASSGNIVRANILTAGAPYYHVALGASCPGNAIADDNRCYYQPSGGSMGPSATVSAIPASSLPMWTI